MVVSGYFWARKQTHAMLMLKKLYNSPQVDILPLENNFNLCFSGSALPEMDNDDTSSWEED